VQGHFRAKKGGYGTSVELTPVNGTQGQLSRGA